jgi:tRNA (guanine37-N1)-methyltransferase
MNVPEILLSGDHGKIAQWRKEQQLKRTEQWRPDVYDKYMQSQPPQDKKKK